MSLPDVHRATPIQDGRRSPVQSDKPTRPPAGRGAGVGARPEGPRSKHQMTSEPENSRAPLLLHTAARPGASSSNLPFSPLAITASFGHKKGRPGSVTFLQRGSPTPTSLAYAPGHFLSTS